MKKNKLPKRILDVGTSSNTFYLRECPQNKHFKKNPNNTVVGELFTTKEKAFPYCIVYKESLPIMKDGYMTWYFVSLNQIEDAFWKKID